MLELDDIDELITKALWRHARGTRRQDCDDLRQEAHIAAIKAQRTFDADYGAREARYVGAAIRNTVVEHVLRMRADPHNPILDVPDSYDGTRSMAVFDHREDAPDYAVDQESFWKVMSRILANPVRHLILVLRYLEGWKSAEIAALIGVGSHDARWSAARVDREACEARGRLSGSARIRILAEEAGIVRDSCPQGGCSMLS